MGAALAALTVLATGVAAGCLPEGASENRDRLAELLRTPAACPADALALRDRLVADGAELRTTMVAVRGR